MISAYWINPEELSSANTQTISATTPYIGLSKIGATGYQSTFAIGDNGGVLWFLPAPSAVPPPLRIAQRDDGNGINERHARIYSVIEHRSSDQSNRITQGGAGSYQ